MGYESRVVIAKRYNTKKQDKILDTVAELELRGMGVDFLNLFDKEWKTGYYDMVSNQTVLTDKYGKTVTYATFNTVYKWCLDNAYKEKYRRLDMLLAVLNVVRAGWYDYKDFIVIHYGY